jgi:NTP pyrophosphatase (non-canonical NTP hydrolase)
MEEMKETLDFGILDYSISSEIATELERAKKKHPNWPTDIFQQLAIMQEEAGEVTKAVLDYHFEKKSISDVREELIQTAAMCVRMLENLPLHD